MKTAMISLGSDMESDNRFFFCEAYFYVYSVLYPSFFSQNALILVKRVSLKSKNIIKNNNNNNNKILV